MIDKADDDNEAIDTKEADANKADAIRGRGQCG